jgi:hypothetical protein
MTVPTAIGSGAVKSALVGGGSASEGLAVIGAAVVVGDRALARGAAAYYRDLGFPVLRFNPRSRRH